MLSWPLVLFVLRLSAPALRTLMTSDAVRTSLLMRVLPKPKQTRKRLALYYAPRYRRSRRPAMLPAWGLPDEQCSTVRTRCARRIDYRGDLVYCDDMAHSDLPEPHSACLTGNLATGASVLRLHHIGLETLR